MSLPDPMTQASGVLAQVLASQPTVTDVVLDSPPGAGKTGVIEYLAIQSAWRHGERCAVATQTNAQVFDVVERLATGWPARPVWAFVREDLHLPETLRSRDNVHLAHEAGDLPSDPCVVVGNSSKWSFWPDGRWFDLLLVDEAYQLRDALFVQVSSMASRHVLVGDPGQIAPVTSVPIDRWRDDPAGPHVSCPQALLHRRGGRGVLRLALPVSRRLPADTVRLVQPAFYPDLSFRALDDERILHLGPGDGRPEDRLLDVCTGGVSLGMGELPEAVTGEFDLALSHTMVDVVKRLFERSPEITDRGERRALRPADVGVVCGHRSQVHAVAEQLGGSLRDVYVETADRYQGLERAVMLVHHPLSGRVDVSAFHLDAGRLCVMLSRHRVAALLFARAGLAERLQAGLGMPERVLGMDDEVHAGRRAHRRLLSDLREQGRVVPLRAD